MKVPKRRNKKRKSRIESGRSRTRPNGKVSSRSNIVIRSLGASASLTAFPQMSRSMRQAIFLHPSSIYPRRTALSHGFFSFCLFSCFPNPCTLCRTARGPNTSLARFQHEAEDQEEEERACSRIGLSLDHSPRVPSLPIPTLSGVSDKPSVFLRRRVWGYHTMHGV